MTTATFASAPGPLQGRLRVPGDKSISHRALLLAALAGGPSTVRGLSSGLDVAATAAAVGAFGAEVERLGALDVVVRGGAERLQEPAAPIDVGNSGTAIRLIAGWAAARRGLTVLVGDASVSSRPMDRVATPLRAMGASIDGRDGGRLAPLVIRGGDLRGIDYTVPVASAQVKGAILLAALGADGPTTVHEPVATRVHTEEMLAAAGVTVRVDGGDVTVEPGPVSARDIDVPADPSQAAFWVVAATLVPGSDLVVEHVYVGPGRAGFVDVLRRMGADITFEEADATDHTADLRVRAAPLRGVAVGGTEIASLIDEIPVLAVAAAYAEGTTTFTDAAELRVKETDRIATMTSELRALGVGVDDRPDGLVISGGGGRPLGGGAVRSHGDHRVAMAMAVAALAGRASVMIDDWGAVATSYPGFEEDVWRCVS